MTAPNVMAHLPPVAQDAQYRLGDALLFNNTDLWLNGTNSDGVRSTFAEPEGWEGLEFITPVDTAGGRDGGLMGPPSVAPRILPVDGAVVAPTPVLLRRYVSALRTKLGPRKQVVWDQYDPGSDRRYGMVCYAMGDFRAFTVPGNGGVAARVEFTLIAANPPWKLSSGLAEEKCTSLPAGDPGGRSYDKTYDYDYGGSTDPGGFIVATNDGDITSWPTFTVTGPVNTPTITNETTGLGFTINANIPAGTTVQIDARTGLVEPGHYRLVGRPWGLAAGSNTIRWRDLSGTGGTENTQLCMAWRHTNQ